MYSEPSGGTTEETTRASIVGHLDRTQRQQARDPLGDLIPGRPRNRAKAPMLCQLLAAKGAEMSLGVADVDSEEHAVIMGIRCSPMSRATLYVIPGSHPAMAVRAMLEHKAIDYKRVDLLPVISRGVLKALRFPGITIPSLKIDDRKLTGSRTISRALDEIQPEPALFPADPEARARRRGGRAMG